MNNQELDITLVDFSRAEDVSAFAKKIFTEANKQGMFVRKEKIFKRANGSSADGSGMDK